MLDKIFYIKKVLGKNGKPIRILKFRTMYQGADKQFFYRSNNNLDNYGKIMDDPRITRLGCILRKYWIDELPQIINFCLGDLSLIGIRAKTKEAWQLYDYREKALKNRPALIPVQYSGCSEQEYLEQLENSSNREEVKRKYLCKTLRNIIFNGVRSR